MGIVRRFVWDVGMSAIAGSCVGVLERRLGCKLDRELDRKYLPLAGELYVGNI